LFRQVKTTSKITYVETNLLLCLKINSAEKYTSLGLSDLVCFINLGTELST
jgi:hypothetical protein